MSILKLLLRVAKWLTDLKGPENECDCSKFQDLFSMQNYDGWECATINLSDEQPP